METDVLLHRRIDTAVHGTEEKIGATTHACLDVLYPPSGAHDSADAGHGDGFRAVSARGVG